MSMTVDSTFSRYTTKLAALGITFDHAQAESITKALIESLIEEIQINAQISNTGSNHTQHIGDGLHTHSAGSIS